MKTIRYIALSVKACSCLFLLGCSVPRPMSLPNLKPLPSRFPVMPDQNNIGTISRDSFFRDAQLKALLNEVLRNNPDLNIALQRVEAAGAWLKMSQGALLPAISFSGITSATQYGKYTMEGVGNFDTNLSPNIDENQRIATNPTPDFWLGLSADWEIDLWGKLRHMKKSARHRFMASVQGTDMVKTMLVAQTAILYYELVSLDSEYKVLEENIRLQERALEIVTVQKEAGRATELAIQQFKAQILNTKAALLYAAQRRVEAENHLNVLAGRYEGNIARTAMKPLDQLFPAWAGAGLPASLLRNRPDIKQAESQMLAAHADLAAAHAAFFPSINISAYTALNAFKGDLLFSAGSLSYQLLGGLTAPLFQKHQLRSRYKIANADQRESYYHYERTVLNAYKDVVNHLSEIRSFAQLDSLKQQEVEALTNGISISEDLYIAGYASYLEIVAAQKSKIEAELQLIEIKRKEIYAVLNLYKSLGGGWH